MIVPDRKSRMISLRFSIEEYEVILHLCSIDSSRSVSDFARNAIQNEIRQGLCTDTRISELDTKMKSLDHEIERLVQMIESQLVTTVASSVVASRSQSAA
jgi:hypothetical protein